MTICNLAAIFNLKNLRPVPEMAYESSTFLNKKRAVYVFTYAALISLPRRHHPYDPSRELIKVLRLQDYFTRPCQLRQEQSLAAQENILEPLHRLDLITH